MSIEIYTLRYGNPPWMKFCTGMDEWCKRHKMKLNVFSEWDPDYPSPKFCEVDMLRHFLAGEADQMMYVDADTVIVSSAPKPSFGPGFHVRPEKNPVCNRFWLLWCEKVFGQQPTPGSIYHNAGIWTCDRASAQILLSVIEKPYHEGIMEQHHFNWWLMLAKAKGLNLIDLPGEWNRYPMEFVPAWIYHIYGVAKSKRFSQFKARGLFRQTPPSRKLVAERKSEWPMFIDAHHLQMLDAIVRKYCPKVVMEIGSHKGVSTQPLLNALGEGIIEQLHIIEPVPTPELLARIKACPASGKVRLHTRPSWELSIPCDFVFIDGDHRWPALADLAMCLAHNTPIIAMHDTRSYDVGIKSCWGSTMAAKILQCAPGREWHEDFEKRPGMWTERGFGWSIKIKP